MIQAPSRGFANPVDKQSGPPAMVFSLGLQACAVYVPFMQRAFHTVPLGWSDWGVMFLVALPIFLITEAVNWVRFGRG